MDGYETGSPVVNQVGEEKNLKTVRIGGGLSGGAG